MYQASRRRRIVDQHLVELHELVTRGIVVEVELVETPNEERKREDDKV